MMEVKSEIAGIAALIGESARATILWHLLSGESRPASELAFYANISAQNASAHLAKLVEAGLLIVESRGRHRYYHIAGPEVAHAMEAIAALAPSAKARTHLPRGQTLDLKYARTCYDHLAGRVAVEICDAMQEKGLLEANGEDFDVTPKGESWLHKMGIGINELRHQRRFFARLCPDWSERRPHLAGALGAALLEQMFRQGWIAKIRSSRAIRVTTKGKQELYDLLGIGL